MSGVQVDVQELWTHANHLRALQERFTAVLNASSHIAMSDDAYGQLCAMLPPILEERHRNQDEGVRTIAENYGLLADAIDECANAYEETDSLTADDFKHLEPGL
ncbi:type VII secretion target [Glycomyces terrestris]|uniref:type VII secretion target n=1 Tax=Glycomyces terrestris TaxID=2493553 RepID=UPI0013155FB5|nr:type VII secretion target [Glycomyces terrestris]